MTPEVSLIMPAWRPRPEWLRAAVESALDEPGADVELLVVDDGSEEPVAPLLAEIDDPRLRVLRVSHRGPYAARDAGLAAARGAFLRFVDADDIVEPGSTGKLLALARAEPGAIAYGATLMCDEELNPQREVTSEQEGWVAESAVLGGFDVYIVSLVVPREVAAHAGAWDEAAFPVSGDWDYALRCLEQAPVRRLGELVTRYRRHGESVTRTADVAAGAEAGRLVLARYFDRHPEQRGSELERRAYLRLHLDRAEAYAWVGERRAAMEELGAAARRNPVAASRAAVRIGTSPLKGLIGRAAKRARPRRPRQG